MLLVQSGVAVFALADFNEQKQLKIMRVTPSGKDVSIGQQLVFQYNRPVVPIGRMARNNSDIPVNISPKLNCQWYWINTSALACQLDNKNKMQAATKYTVTMNPGIRAKDGATIDAVYTHSFITQRPQMRYFQFYDWQGPGTPIIRLTFNQSVSRSSVEKYIAFVYRKKGVDNAYITHGITVEKDPNDREDPIYIAVSGSNNSNELIGEEARRRWLISPKKELLLDTRIDLKVTPGLVSALGKEPGVEDRVLITFHTFPEFAFLGVICTTNDDNDILITKENNHKIGKCNPLEHTALSFSTPVVNSQIKNNILIHPNLAGNRNDYDPWANTWDYSQLDRAHKKGMRYNVWLPEYLKAVQTYTLATLPADLDAIDKIKSLFVDIRSSDLEDEFGRVLKEPIDITFFTDHRKPNFELLYRTAVLEKQVNSDLPLYMTNLDRIMLNYKKLTINGVKDSQLFTLDDIPQVEDVQFVVPMHVRDMLENKSGAIYGTVETKPHVEKSPIERVFFASVSPYQLHVKVGHYNTLVWVTDLATGEPVNNAHVQIYKDKVSNLSSSFNALDKGYTNASGLVLLKGMHILNPTLDLFRYWCTDESQNDCDRLFVRADNAGEMAVMPLQEEFELSIYRASNDTIWPRIKRKYGHIHTWGTTAQGVYRAGKTMQYKFYVRDQNNDHYVPAPNKSYTLEIVDPTGKTVHEITDITLSTFGSYSGEYTVPENAAVGWYRFKLSSSFTHYTWQPMRVLVSDFSPESFKVRTSLNGDLFHPGDNVEVSSAAKLYSGGAYTDAEARTTVILRSAYFSSPHPIANEFTFDSYKHQSLKKVFQKIDNVDNKGEISHTFPLPREDIIYGRLTVESAIRDDRGKYIAASATADYIALDRLVGLKHTKWFYEEDKLAQIKYIVVDKYGVPIANTQVLLDINRLQTKVAKVKGAGNVYLTNYIDEWIPSGTCKGMSKVEPLQCDFIPEEPGTYKVTATIKDTKGNAHSTEIRAWVSGKGHVLWHTPDDNSLQIIPEKTDYNIGDKARYLIKNPYPGAKALITIERYGVIKSWVQTLNESTSVIEFEVEKNFMPGFYLSVIVMSPRIDTSLPKMGQVDLSKPTFKVGYVKVPVKDPYKQIDVSIQTDAAVYKPRDKVTATIHVQPKHKNNNEDDIEIAVVVLDEAVLDLIEGGQSYFDPYEGFYKLDELDLVNYSLLTRLIGQQKFAKKGANPGGDGGVNISMRSLFKYVSYWNPSIKPNKNGNAMISFNAPDNLTGWRVLAFAVTPSDRMGLGATNFKVNRSTEIRPVMPNQITQGDVFQAGFSVMNRTDKPRDITVTIDAKGHIQPTNVFSKTIHLEPYKRQTVYMPVSSAHLPQSRDINAGAIHFSVKALDAMDGDGIEHIIPIHKQHLLESVVNYGTTTKDKVSESLHFPKNIHTDIGDVSMVLSPSVIGSVDGAFQYIRDYPYTCWEQKLSKGVMALHYQNLKGYLSDDLKWEESKSLSNDILMQAANYQAPNGGMAYFISQDQYVSPYLSAYTALAFNWLHERHHDVPEAVESKLHAYLERLLKKDVMPMFYSRGISSTVRSIALFALAKHGKVSLSDLERYRSHIQYMSLFGKSHYLQAALEVNGAEVIAKEVMDMILAHSNQSGGKFSFKEELDDSYTRIIATSLRANCGILSAMTSYAENNIGASVEHDIPFKLMRHIVQKRGNREHWKNTQENIFCMNSLVDYARIYENIKPTMRVSATLNGSEFGKTNFNDLHDDSVTFSRSITADDPGTHQSITLSRKGNGRLYYAARMNYSLLEESANRLNAGIDIRKEYSVERNGEWILLGNPNEISLGELVRVDIYVSLPVARYFVVVDDPVPGGLEPINRDLATSSSIDANKGDFQVAGGAWWFQYDDWHYFSGSRWSFYHKEIRYNAVRFYSDYLPAGNYHLSYAAQAIAKGSFTKIPVHAKEMYDSDVFGKGLPGMLIVGD